MSKTRAGRHILTVNVGSSSARLALFALDGTEPRLLVQHHAEGSDDSVEAAISGLRDKAPGIDIDAVAHRIVHGGPSLLHACVVSNDVLRALDAASELAPLHNPPAVRWLRQAQRVLPADVRHIAVFDTTFFVNLPEVARTYAIPQSLVHKYALRRYGFHGLAHTSMWQSACALRPSMAKGGRLISLQLGSGCSAAAVCGGRPLDTSMGFTPLEGLVMGTRCGDLDPGLIMYLQEHAQIAPKELNRLLVKESGLLGISGHSADMRKVVEGDDAACRLALQVYCYRVRKYLGAYAAVLQGVDAIVVGGGVGEHQAGVVDAILRPLDWLGLDLSPQAAPVDHPLPRQLTRDGSRVQAWAVQVDEARVMVREAEACL